VFVHRAYSFICAVGMCLGTSAVNASDATWSHNGSLMQVSVEGEARTITYLQPRPGMVEAGAKSGDVVFVGKIEGGRLAGTAFLFSKKCGRISYLVAGTESVSGTEIVLQGRAPRVSTNCQVISTSPDELIFEKNVQTDSAATTTVPAVPSSTPQQLPPVQKEASGTGFYVTADGLLMTNAHVVDGCTRVAISGSGGSEIVRVAAEDATNDLALLESGAAPAKFALLRTGVRLGEGVAAVGYPLSGLLSTSGNFTLGNITALVGLKDDSRYFQISTPVQPGNSGGPLLDSDGNLIGVVSAKLNALEVMIATNGDIPQNVNFAIKASVVANFLESHGVTYKTGGLGAAMQPADIADLAKAISVYVKCN
jgi:S1-C subfamily serine protease